MTGTYDDIIHLPHYRSKHRSHMSIHDRAAQFSPFAALTGLDAAIEETGRITDSRIELEEYGRDLLDRKLVQLMEQLKERPKTAITYFRPDDRKIGGTYIEITGEVQKIDLHHKLITMDDGQTIPTDEIVDIVLLK